MVVLRLSQLHQNVSFSQHRSIRPGVSSPCLCHPAIQEKHLCFLRRSGQHRRRENRCRALHLRHLLVRSLQSRHGLPDWPRSVRAPSSRSVPLAQKHDSSPAQDHRTHPGSSCPRLDARYPRWHWRQGCCWCWQRRRSHGSSRRTRDHRLVVSVPWRLLAAARGGVRSTLLVLATSPDPRVPADTRTRSREPCRLLVASLARCQLVPTSGGVGVPDLLVLATSLASRCLL